MFCRLLVTHKNVFATYKWVQALCLSGILPCSAPGLEREVMRGSVDAEPWLLAPDSGPEEEPHSASLDD